MSSAGGTVRITDAKGNTTVENYADGARTSVTRGLNRPGLSGHLLTITRAEMLRDEDPAARTGSASARRHRRGAWQLTRFSGRTRGASWVISDVLEPYASLPVYANAIRAVDRILREATPRNVNVDEVIVTGERDRACIVVMPHHQLGGVSLLIWSNLEGVQLSWGHVTTLRTHDDLDLAVRVSRLIAPDDLVGIDSALAAEAIRPISVRRRSPRVVKSRLECSIDIDGNRTVIGRVQAGGATFDGVLTTTLSDRTLPFTVRIPVEELRRSA